MEQYTVTGMSCAACSTRVEKAVSKVPGVTSCSVSLLTNSMGVEGTASEKDIVKAVTDAGYGASKKGSKAAGNAQNGSMSTGGGPIGDEEQGNPCFKEKTAVIAGIFNCPDVFFHGAYDVGLAASSGACR